MPHPRSRLPAAVLCRLCRPLGAWLLLALLAGPLARAQRPPPPVPSPVRPSQVAASLYLPSGRGYDFSLAGFKDGLPLPSPPIVYNVKDFGAKGDNQTDDTAAIKAAVAKATASAAAAGVVYFPAGTYILRDKVEIRRSKVVLRGAGAGATTIRIPVSLSDVYEGTWTIDNNGEITSSWSFGGSFILFQGRTPRSAHTDSRLASVTGTLPAGSFRVPVSSTDKFFLGQWVRVFVNDVSTDPKTFGRRLQANATVFATDDSGSVTISAITSPVTGATIGRLVTRPIPERLRQDAVFMAAMDGLAERGSQDPEARLSPAAALSADRVAMGVPPGGGGGGVAAVAGGVGTAAAPGTVLAWLYGDGLSDSGSNGAVARDDVSLSAKVTAVGASWIELDRELPFPVQAGWEAVVHSYYPSVQEGGVESLTIAFDHSMVGPHFTDRGYNAIEFKSCANMWIQNVTILNADNAIFAGWADHSTFRGITVGVTRRRWVDAEFRDAENGHHAISITHAHSNLIDRFNIAAKYIHDLTVAWGAALNVFTRGRGTDVNMDHHRSGPYANLFTDLDLGYGLRPFASGGAKNRGAYSALGSTFYNLRASSQAPPPLTWPPPSPPPPRPPPRFAQPLTTMLLPLLLLGGACAVMPC